ncbi:MAG: methyltransferase domain-containing protein, partial [Candidatus Eisenbacteria bacterium]|nr:methyltransferase domain-containing protein [Candidatus Latescibacterota bacterium]MBD3302625.1 methyltransferase domain-containing protein [Candidatus Eisenbacteria bacterium]
MFCEEFVKAEGARRAGTIACAGSSCAGRLTAVADPYERFARVYDRWQAGYPQPFSKAILPFYEREILRRGVPARSLADLACGTGSFLVDWAARNGGWTLTGTDGSRAMLSVARGKLRKAKVPVRLIEQPLERTALPAPVGAAVCVFDSVNHLTRLPDLRRFFRAAAR